MKLNDKEINVEDAFNFAEINNIIGIRRENGIVLSNYQIHVLGCNGLNYNNYSSLKNLLFDIEECLDDNYNEELDNVSSQLAEYIYYNESKK